MFNMFGNIFGRMFTPPAAKKEESVFEGAECVNCKAEAGYNPYCDGVRCYDKEDYLPEGYTEDELRSVYYDLNQEAGIDYLVESADFDEVDDYYNPGTEEVDPAFVLEAVTVKKFSRLEGVIRRGMLPVMKEHMKMKDPTTGEPINVLDPIVGKCKKSGGFAYVTAQIPFSDGQVVSIIFHAPEGDGKKIGPSDMVVAFRWLLNKRDITAVVAPEDGKEISLKTIALRLAQLVGKNAKRFAATQKEVQAEKRQLEELQEKQKELDEQARTYEEQIAGAQEAKTSTAEEIGSLQAQLAKQLATNRELEVKLAGLKKLEEEGRKTQPEPTPEPEPKPGRGIARPLTVKEQKAVDFVVNDLTNVVEGKYDNDLKELVAAVSNAICRGPKTRDDVGADVIFPLVDKALPYAEDLVISRLEQLPDGTVPKNVLQKAKETLDRLRKNGDAFKRYSYMEKLAKAVIDFDAGLAKQTAANPYLSRHEIATLDNVVKGKMDNNLKVLAGTVSLMAQTIKDKESSPLLGEAISYVKNLMLNKYEQVLKEPKFNDQKHKEQMQGIRDKIAALDEAGNQIKLCNFLENMAARLEKHYASKKPSPTPEPAPQVTEPEPVPAEPIEPEPAQDDKSDKPEWVNDMQDIIDGKYDNDLKKMGKLLNLAIEELDKPGCDPKWEELANEAADRRTVLLKAKAKAAGF